MEAVLEQNNRRSLEALKRAAIYGDPRSFIEEQLQDEQAAIAAQQEQLVYEGGAASQDEGERAGVLDNLKDRARQRVNDAVNKRIEQRLEKSGLKKLGQKELKQVGTKATARAVKFFKVAKIGTAATVIGLVVTYLLMTIQFIGGNWLHSKLIPPLALWEQILWGFVTGLLMVAALIVMILFVIMLIIGLGPIAALGVFGADLIGLIF